MISMTFIKKFIKKISIVVLVIAFLIAILNCPPPRPRDIDEEGNSTYMGMK